MSAKDKKRLDWLEAPDKPGGQPNLDYVFPSLKRSQPWVIITDGDDIVKGTLRQAIDAAMKPEKAS